MYLKFSSDKNNQVTDRFRICMSSKTYYSMPGCLLAPVVLCLVEMKECIT